MKSIIHYFSVFALVLFTFSCKKDNQPEIKNPLDGLKIVQTIVNNQHKIEVYTNSGKLDQGHNNIYLLLKKQDGTIVRNADINWQPMMHMAMMNHSCPSVKPTLKNADAGLYAGAIIFQMASNATEYWDLTFNYTVGSESFTASDGVLVNATNKQRVTSFKGTDNVKYILALVTPTAPKVGLNDVEALLYKMDNMTTFTPVTGYTVKLDPRMPGMGNHGSPNNVDLTHSANGIYKGKLSLTMTGYWKINMQLLDATNNILKGEAVTTSVESSSVYWEIEF